jgi:hypothetical protein
LIMQDPDHVKQDEPIEFEFDRPYLEALDPSRFDQTQRKPKARIHARHFLIRPRPATGRVVTRQEFELLKDIVDRIIFVVQDEETDLERMRRKLATLDSQYRRHVMGTRLKIVSDENVRQLRTMFGLSEIQTVEEDVLADMRGMFHEYAEEGTDSVELLRRAREE